jgi:hypothetical protein
MRWLTSFVKLGSKTVAASAFILAASYLLWTAGSASWGAVHHDRQKSLQKIESHKTRRDTRTSSNSLSTDIGCRILIGSK